jgi:hypothetical protein
MIGAHRQFRACGAASEGDCLETGVGRPVGGRDQPPLDVDGLEAVQGRAVSLRGKSSSSRSQRSTA